MTLPDIIQRTADHVKSTLSGESSGHDWWHVYRVWQMSKRIGRAEGADMFVVELAALLHDIADWKFHDGDDKAGSRAAREWLRRQSVDNTVIDHVCTIIDDLSFKGAGVPTSMKTKEGMVVQDADRLDALGAIGIARAFSYGGFKGRQIYDPDIPPAHHATFEEYKKSTGPTINHFHEKLFLLKGLLNTEAARLVAEERHSFMEEYVRRFLREWDGKE